MNDYINAAFARMDLQQIREFLLGDTRYKSLDKRTYRERLEQTHAPIYKRITDCYADATERTKAENELADALNAQQQVYMEMGMKAGARLIYQLLLSDSPTLPRSQDSEHNE